VFCPEIAVCDRRPRRQIVERIASSDSVGRPEEQLYRRHLTGEPPEMLSEFWQRGVVSGFEQRQQGLADRAALLAHVAQQQLLAFLIGRSELGIEEGGNNQENDREQPCLCRQRPRPADAEAEITSA
jgi:hypothetical protein